jgi:hypothetical protein
MTIYERIDEIKNTVELTMDNATEAYAEAEAELVTLLSDRVKDAEVDCSAHGTGKVVAAIGDTLDDMFVDIAFDEVTKSFSLKHVMTNTFVKLTDVEIREAWKAAFDLHIELTTKYKELKFAAELLKKEEKKKAEAEKQAEIKYNKLKAKAIKEFDNLVQQPKAPLSAVDGFYYALGWLAAHVGNITASIPDYLTSAFEKHFGTEANPRIVDSKKKTSGGFAYQWGIGMTARFRTKGLSPVPETLTQYLNPTGKALTNTNFIWDLIDNYGFKFGKEQDVEKIKNTIPGQYHASFEAGLIA